MAAADVAMWLAIMTRLGATDGSVTAGMTSAFLGAARREPFRCTARIVKLGRRLVYGVAESVGAGGRLLAHHSLTYVRASRGEHGE
jgi:acyl-coenzyme A thioesterase PaaI-like protein